VEIGPPMAAPGALAAELLASLTRSLMTGTPIGRRILIGSLDVAAHLQENQCSPASAGLCLR